jgi:hypothetical protein
MALCRGRWTSGLENALRSQSPRRTAATIAFPRIPYLGLNLAKITAEDAALAREGSSTDAKAAAAVRFAVQVAKTRGGVSDADIAAVKAAGFGEAQIVEIVGLVAENVFTNLLNKVAQTDIDFPVFHTGQAA